ncbi:MAG TPA: oligosaccharide flippase family protein [Acidimicrobiia bacterium]
MTAKDTVLPFFRPRLMWNLGANYGGAAINAFVPLLAIPVLIRMLGPEFWGLVAFVNLMVVLMMMLNVGISQALSREFAHRWTNEAEGHVRAAYLLRGYEGLYWIVALAVGACVLPFTPWIADNWLNTSPEAEDMARYSVAFAVVLFVVTLPASIYRGTLLAIQEHVLFNVIRSTAVIAKFGLGVLAVQQTGSVLGYLTFFVAMSFLETLALAIAAWRFMPSPRRTIGFNLHEVRLTLKFSITMTVLVMMGVATTQIDRLLVSVLMPVEELGVYSIAVSLAFGVLQITYPLFTSVMPVLVSIDTDSHRRLRAIRNLLATVLAMVAVLGGLYALAGSAALSFWLGDPALAQAVQHPLMWLLVGAALNTVYNVGYTNWVSLGQTRWIAWVNILSLGFGVSVLPFTIPSFGLVGATASYVIVNVIGACFTIAWFARFRPQEKALQT